MKKLVGVLFLAAASAAAQTSAPRVADFFSLKGVSDARIAPDGKSVAFVVSEWDFKENLLNTDVWIAETAGGAPRRLTASVKKDESPRWSPDGKTIAFLSDRKAGDEKETFRQIWLISPTGGEAVRLTNHGAAVASFEWSRDAKKIAFAAPVPPTTDEKKRKEEKDDASVVDVDDLKPNALWIVNVGTSAVVRVSAGKEHVTSVSWSPDGARLAATVAPSPKVPDSFETDILSFEAVENGGGKAPVPLVKRPGVDEGPSFSPDGKWVAFHSSNGRVNDWAGNRSELSVVAASGGAPRLVTKGFDEEVRSAEWSPDSATLYFVADSGMTSQLHSVPAAGGAVTTLTSGFMVLAGLSLSSDGRTAATVIQSSVEAPDVHLVAMTTATPGKPLNPARLTTMNPALEKSVHARVERVSWKGPDAMPIEGLLVLPPGAAPPKKLPLILLVHGGPAGRFAHTNPAFSRIYPLETFSEKGIAVLMANPRGSGGYGEKFRKANVRDWGGKDYEDLMAGVDMLIARGTADPDRLGVMGWSYGGYMTSTIITKTNRFKFASTGAPVTDLWSFYYTADIPEFIESYFGIPWDDFDMLKTHSAMWSVKNVKTPTLILHGEADARVPASQGRALYLALKKRGVPVEMVTYPREPHGPAEPKHVKDIRTRLVAWAEKYLLGTP